MEENQSKNGRDPVSTNEDLFQKSSRLGTEDHPLINIVILDNIVRYLDYKDLKTIRFVCQRWKQVTENVFWKLSMIKVRCQEELLENELEEHALEIAEENQMLIETFESTFPSPGELPTNAIIFIGCISRRTLEYFWKQRGSSTLTSVRFSMFCEPTKESIDLNSFITPKLTTLNVGCSLHNKLTISFQKLANIQNLRLYRSEIIFDGKIVPRELDLTLCSVTYEGKQFKLGDRLNTNAPKILINDLVDFSKIKKLILDDNFCRLDVGRDMKELEYIALRRVEVIGLADSQWKTNFIYIDGCIFIGDRMEIKAFPDIDNSDIYEIESLPKTLEHLWLEISRSYFYLPQPLICEYPKLKSLTIRIFMNREYRILDFTNCTSLVDFQFSNSSGMYEMDFNRIKLPNSIKNVKLRNVIPNTDAPWKLDTLVLYNYPFSSIESALRHFTPTKLAIQLNSKLEREEDQMVIVNLWRNSSIEQLALGYLGVDEVERYFLFTNKNNSNSNGEMEAIDWNSFKRLTSLNVHMDLLPKMRSF